MKPTAETPASQKKIVKGLGFTMLGVGLLSLSSNLTGGFDIRGRVDALLSKDVTGKSEDDTAGFSALETQLAIHEALGRGSKIFTGISSTEGRSMKSSLEYRGLMSRERAKALQDESDEEAAQAEYKERLAKGLTTKDSFQ